MKSSFFTLIIFLIINFSKVFAQNWDGNWKQTSSSLQCCGFNSFITNRNGNGIFAIYKYNTDNSCSTLNIAGNQGLTIFNLLSGSKNGTSSFKDKMYGHWNSTSCIPWGAPNIYGKIEMNAGDITSLEFNFFEDSSCNIQKLTIKYSGPLNIIGASSAVIGAYEVDYSHQHIEITANSNSELSILNNSKCGNRTDWSIGTTIDVSNSGCLPYGILSSIECPREKDLTIINSSTLTFGERRVDLCTTRPTSIGTVSVVRKSPGLDLIGISGDSIAITTTNGCNYSFDRSSFGESLSFKINLFITIILIFIN